MRAAMNAFIYDDANTLKPFRVKRAELIGMIDAMDHEVVEVVIEEELDEEEGVDDASEKEQPVSVRQCVCPDADDAEMDSQSAKEETAKSS